MILFEKYCIPSLVINYITQQFIIYQTLKCCFQTTQQFWRTNLSKVQNFFVTDFAHSTTIAGLHNYNTT